MLMSDPCPQPGILGVSLIKLSLAGNTSEIWGFLEFSTPNAKQLPAPRSRRFQEIKNSISIPCQKEFNL
jgi:hypothetical protein